jgi:ApaG protein
MKRHWFIKDSNGESYEVKGEGVIGKQPVIQPGASHTYSSFCVLKSFKGSMEGYYEMVREDGSVLYVTIPKFLLSAHSLN